MATYAASATLYDALYRWKDYAAEAETLRRLIEASARRPIRTLLDVACGTGAHLVHLTSHYDCTGLDLSADLLGVARQKLPDIALVQGDMREFDLDQTFDAVVCLFSAIGYVQTVDGLRQAVASMARHVAPGGVLAVEPWLRREEFTDGRLGMLTVDEPERKIVRAHTSKRDGDLSLMDFHYLVVTPQVVTHFTELHALGLFTDDAYEAAFVDAGLAVQRDAHGLDGRGLYLGVEVVVEWRLSLRKSGSGGHCRLLVWSSVSVSKERRSP